MRLLKPPSDKRRFISVSRTAGNWVRLLPEKIRRSPEIPLSPVHWQVVIKRDHGDDLESRHDLQIQRAVTALEQSRLPGERYDSNTMQVATSPEPAKVVEDPWKKPWPSVGFIAVLVVVMTVIIVGATLPWLDVPGVWKIIGAIVALISAVWAGYWMTGTSLKRWPRFGAAALISVVGLLLGLIIASIIKSPEAPPNIIAVLAIAVGVFFTFTGWVHLAIRHPGIRSLWSLPAITAGIAGAYAWARLLVSDGENLLGLPTESVANPGWFHVVITLYVIVFIGGTALLLGGFFGWCVYFGASAGTLLSRASTNFIGLIITILIIGLAASHIMLKPSTTLGEWRSMLADKQTPTLSSDFLYRACLAPGDDTLPDDVSTDSKSVVVVEANDGGVWTWGIEEDVSDDEMTRFEPGDLEITRIRDGEEDC